MSGNRLFAIALIAVLLASLAACGQHSSRVLNNIINPQAQPHQQQPQNDSVNNGPLPGVFELDGRITVSHAVSVESTITSQGWEALPGGQTGTNGSNTLNVEQNGTGLNLRAFSPGEYSYAVYGQEIGAEPKPLQTLIDSDVCKVGGGRDDEIPINYYIGAADYTVGSWRWFGPFGAVDVMVTVNSETLKSRFKSPSDNYYLCVLAANGSKAASALPAEGYVADFPIDLSARSASAEGDDPWGLVVKEIVTWVRDNLYTEPAVVTGLAAAADEAGVTLTWDRNADPDVFLYQVIRTDAPPPSIIATVTPSEELPRYRDNNCVPGRKSVYKLRARNDAGFGGETEIKAIRELGTPNVSASDGEFSNRISIIWSLVPGAVSYKIYRSEQPNGILDLIRTSYDLVPPLSFNDYAVTPEQWYYYFVQAVGEDAEGPISFPNYGYTIVLDPVEVIASDGEYPDKVLLTWGEESSAERYHVYRSTDETKADAVMIQDLPFTVTTWSDTSTTGSPWNQPRYYFVRPYAGMTEGVEGQGDYGFRNLAVPLNVTASQGTDAEQVTVNWDTVNNATRYKIYRSESPIDPTPTEIGEVDAPLTSFNDAAPGWGTEVLNEGTHYYYYVAALHDGPDSERSSISSSAEGWRGIGIPQNVTATDGSYTDRIVFSWDSVSQADAYKVYRGGSYLGQVDAPAAMYSDFTAVGGTTYSYMVAALTIDAEEGAQSDVDEGQVNAAPVAILTTNPDPAEGEPPLVVDFDASGSSDVDGAIVDYQWDWTSDGTYDWDSEEESTASHTYPFSGTYTCEVMVIDDQGGMATASAQVYVRTQSWAVQTVDSVGEVGRYSSLEVVNGNPAISYYDDTHCDLMYIRASNMNGTEWNSPIALDTSIQSGMFNSLAIINGNPAISYLDDTNHVLRYIRSSDQNGDEWGSPVAADNSGVTGYDGSLCVVNGKPAISYWRYQPTGEIRYVRATDVDGNTWGTPTILDSGVGDPATTSLAVINGNPAVSYLKTQCLYFVRASDADGSSWQTPVIADNSVLSGYYSSLAIVNGCPAISYRGGLTGALMFIRANDEGGASWGAGVAVDTPANVGLYTSMCTIGGYPSIAYYDGAYCILKFARASDSSGITWETPETVDGIGIVGQYSSMTVVNGTPAIAYQDVSNGDLKFARLQ